MSELSVPEEIFAVVSAEKEGEPGQVGAQVAEVSDVVAQGVGQPGGVCRAMRR